MTDFLKELSPKELSEQKKRFEWLINHTITIFHFIHQIFGILHKEVMMAKTSIMPTMGVRVSNGRMTLVWNPAFLQSLSDEEAIWVFMHETMHLILHHCTNRKFVNSILGNIATDLAVNEMIPNVSYCTQPKECLLVDNYKKIPIYSDIKNGQTAEWYYDYLRSKSKEAAEYMKKNGGKGEKGGIPVYTGEESEDPRQGQDSHEGWGEDEIAEEKVRSKVNEIDKMDGWGTISEGTKEMIRAAQIRRINWRNKIRTFFGNLVWKARQSTRKRPNRRTGYVHPGSKRLHVDRYLAGVDTSGSIDSELLAKWITVINNLAEDIPVDMMQFDWEKQSDPVPWDRRKVAFEFKGRGGTNFQPVVDTVNKMGYKGVVFLTDGCADQPTKPKNAHVLWVLPVGYKPPVEWGDRVYMTREG